MNEVPTREEVEAAVLWVPEAVPKLARALLAEVERLKKEADRNRPFPLQRNGSSGRERADEHRSCPWWVAEVAYRDYSAKYGTSQSLERLAERGGFCNGEMNEHFPGWHTATEENARLRERVAELEKPCPTCAARYSR